MKPLFCSSSRSKCSRTTLLAAQRISIPQQHVPSTGRGGTASTSGRGGCTNAPARVLHAVRRASSAIASVDQQGGLGLNDLLDNDLTEAPLTPRQIINRRIKGCRTLADLCSLVLEECTTFESVNVSHALARLAKLNLAHSRATAAADPHDRTAKSQQLRSELRPAIDTLTKRMHQLIGSYDSWGATQSLWAYAQLGYHDERVLRALSDVALELAPILKPMDCVNTVVAFAYMDFLHTKLLRQIVTTVLDTLDDFQPGEVCQLLWGFARLGCHPGESLISELVEAMDNRLPQYSTQELVLVLWSLVRLGYKPGPRFLRDAEGILLERLPHMVPVDVCLSVWALARLRYKAVRLLDEVPQAIGPMLRRCSNAELCSLMSGFATAHHYHRVLLEEVASVVQGRLDRLTHQEVCVVLWTYGTFRHRPAHPHFGKQLANALYNRMEGFTPQGLAMIVKALAQLQWRSEALLREIIAASEAKLHEFKPLEMSQLLWGLSALECRNLHIFYAVVRRCIAILQDPRHPHYRTMMHHRVVNSVIVSCQRLGYVPWTLIDFAESKGIRVKQPGILNSRDEDDEGMVLAPSAAEAPATLYGCEEASEQQPHQARAHAQESSSREIWSVRGRSSAAGNRARAGGQQDAEDVVGDWNCGTGGSAGSGCCDAWDDEPGVEEPLRGPPDIGFMTEPGLLVPAVAGAGISAHSQQQQQLELQQQQQQRRQLVRLQHLERRPQGHAPPPLPATPLPHTSDQGLTEAVGSGPSGAGPYQTGRTLTPRLRRSVSSPTLRSSATALSQTEQQLTNSRVRDASLHPPALLQQQPPTSSVRSPHMPAEHVASEGQEHAVDLHLQELAESPGQPPHHEPEHPGPANGNGQFSGIGSMGAALPPRVLALERRPATGTRDRIPPPLTAPATPYAR